MPLWASAHAPSGGAAPASTTTVLGSALRALLIACSCWRALFGAGAFHIFRFSGAFFTTFRIFFLQTKGFFHLLHFFRIKSLGFIFSSSTLVHVSITHGLHQFATHGNHLLAGLAQHFLFQFFKFSDVSIFFKARDLAFLFFNLFFFHHTTGLLGIVLAGAGCRRPRLLILFSRFKRRIQVRSGFDLIFLVQLNSFFRFSRARSKRTGYIHAFKTMLVRLGSWRLRVFKCRDWWRYGFRRGWRWFSAMENRGC